MILVIDNYDSFVYNLVQYLGELDSKIIVRRNDEIKIEDVQLMHPSAIIISPGPGYPAQAGNSCEIIRAFAYDIPILGVCLGHQSIAAVYGGKIIQTDTIVHGKVTSIYHDGSNMFQDIKNPFSATRYHSLIVDGNTLPECFTVTAWTDDGLIMGLRHKKYPVSGVQFHPESILTTCGKRLISNFLKGVEREHNTV